MCSVIFWFLPVVLFVLIVDVSVADVGVLDVVVVLVAVVESKTQKIQVKYTQMVSEIILLTSVKYLYKLCPFI